MEDLIKEMELSSKKTLEALAKADAEIVAKVKEQEDKDKKAFEKQEADLKSKLKEAEDAIKKQIKDTEEKLVIPDVKPTDKKVDLTKMTEAHLIEYGKSIGADVDKKYSKAKNLENIKAKQ